MYPRWFVSILSWRSVLILAVIAAMLQATSIFLTWTLRNAESRIASSNSIMKVFTHSREFLSDHETSQLLERNSGAPNLANTLEMVYQESVVDKSEQYRILPSFLVPSDAVHNAVTLVTQCSSQHMHKIRHLADVWQGPISVAVFALLPEVESLVEKMLLLRRCFHLVRDKVTFSLVFPHSPSAGELFLSPLSERRRHFLNKRSTKSNKKNPQGNKSWKNFFSLNWNFLDSILLFFKQRNPLNVEDIKSLVSSHSNSLGNSSLFSKHLNVNRQFHKFKLASTQQQFDQQTETPHSCPDDSNLRQYFNKSDSSFFNNYVLEGVQYPNNLLRNVALDAVKSKFQVVLDIDMIPSENLHNKFLQFIKDFKTSHDGISEPQKVAFVLPAYEIEENIEVPLDKQSLLALVKKNLARPFYGAVCAKCQAPTNYSLWETLIYDNSTYQLSWQDPWEPFYIAIANGMPRYDQRFKQFGFNRISQVCELHIADYSFQVLPFGFVVHEGFKRKEAFHPSKNKEQERNRLLFRKFKRELKLRYPTSIKRCY